MYPFKDKSIPENIGIILTLRDGRTKEHTFGQRFRWKKEDNLRWSQKYKNILGQAVHVTLVQHNGFDATEVIVSITNGIPNQGVTYFTNLNIRVDEEVYELNGKHIIRPRGIIAKRFVVGPDAEKVKTYQHIPEGWVPYWLPKQAENSVENFSARTEDNYGPYKPFWNNFHKLADSHGGAGIAPYSDWVKCQAGYELRSLEFYGEVCRSPIACLKEKNGKPLFIDAVYWLGRTPEHELAEFDDWPDDWCEYAQWLMSYRAHDHTHLWRMIRAAWQLAPYDPFARMFLQWAWHDCKMNLEGEAGDKQESKLYWSLKKKVANTRKGVGAWWADRGFYHIIRCFLSVSPYISKREVQKWHQMFRRSLMHVATPQGVCMATFDTDDDAKQRLGNLPLARGFQVQLLASVYGELELHDLLYKLRESFPDGIPSWFETLNPNNKFEKEAYKPYTGLYKIGIYDYENFEDFVNANASRGINGSSQDFDCINPRSYWGLV